MRTRKPKIESGQLILNVQSEDTYIDPFTKLQYELSPLEIEALTDMLTKMRSVCIYVVDEIYRSQTNYKGSCGCHQTINKGNPVPKKCFGCQRPIEIRHEY